MSSGILELFFSPALLSSASFIIPDSISKEYNSSPESEYMLQEIINVAGRDFHLNKEKSCQKKIFLIARGKFLLEEENICHGEGQGCTRCGSLVVGLAAKHRSCSRFSASTQAQPANRCQVSELLLSILYYQLQQKTKK